jgi:hypothetical protein
LENETLNKILTRLVTTALLATYLVVAAGCSDSADSAAASDPQLSAPVPSGMVRGTVAETMDSGGYTYVLVNADDEQRWIAGPLTPVSVGNVVQFSQGMAMSQFTSQTLGRTFDVLYFVGAIENLSGPTLPEGHPQVGEQPDAATPDIVVSPEIEGQDIAWVYANQSELAGQQVSIKGKVVKYNAKILGSNFIHLQDGSGSAGGGNHDLVVTSTDETAVGETIIATGTVILDKDFGAGYSFPVLLEGASISKD